MKSAHQPVSLAVHRRLSSQFRSDSRPPDFRKSPDRPLSVASVSSMEGLPATHYPLLTTHSPLTTFRINTCKSVSKQTTLTTFRINTYKKTGEGGTPTLPRLQRPASSIQPPASRTVCVTWRLYPLCPHSIAHTSRRHGGGVPRRPRDCSQLTSCRPFVFILLQIPFPATSFVSHPYKSPGGTLKLFLQGVIVGVECQK